AHLGNRYPLRFTLFPYTTLFRSDMARPDWFGGLERLGDTVPAVNIKEQDKSFSVELAVPGMKKEDFKIELDKDVLTVSAEISSEIGRASCRERVCECEAGGGAKN